MPYHGEASKVVWRALKDEETKQAGFHAQMTADLPLAGLTIDRSVTLATSSALFFVSETIINKNKLGRIFNIDINKSVILCDITPERSRQFHHLFRSVLNM